MSRIYDSDSLRRWKRATWWFSVIFLFVGVTICLAALWLTVTDASYPLNSALPVGYLVTGSFIFVISFVGWYSSKRESKSLLIVYIVLLLVSIIVVLSITVATYVDEQRHLGMSADLHWQENYEAGDPDGVLAQVSSSYECCGFDDALDRPVPDDCIEQYPERRDGCARFVIEALEDSLRVVLITGIAAVFVMLLGLVFAYLTYREAPSQEELDRMVDEEIKRLNASWQPAPTNGQSKQDSVISYNE